MTYSPNQKNTRVRWIVAALLAAAAVSYAVPIARSAMGMGDGGAILQFAAVLFIIAAVFVTIRYVMTHFTYIIRPRSDIPENGAIAEFADGIDVTALDPALLDFVVIKAQGSRPGAMECVLPLDELIGTVMLDDKNTKQSVCDAWRKKAGTAEFVFYDYTITPGDASLSDKLALLFLDGKKYVCLFIEPDDRMKSYFRLLKP